MTSRAASIKASKWPNLVNIPVIFFYHPKKYQREKYGYSISNLVGSHHVLANPVRADLVVDGTLVNVLATPAILSEL